MVDPDLRKRIRQDSADIRQSSGGSRGHWAPKLGRLRRGRSGSGMEGPDHPGTIDPGEPSRPGPRGQCRSASGVLHIDDGGQARFPHRRVDGDGMIRQVGYAQTRQARARGVPDRTVNRGESGSLTGTPRGR